ncbi:putative holin-like toxin [Oscillospiraceae bacterium NTUH-002-81]|nr:putative holin-like toxin [Oscillospiraceae bacterium NTUH-002-81]
MSMVTYSDLIQFCLLIVAIISLVYKIAKKITAPARKTKRLFF